MQSEETHIIIPRTCEICLVISEISSWKGVTLAGVNVLHLQYKYDRCTAHDDGEQNGARMKLISPTISDLRSLTKQSEYYDYDASKKILRIKKGT